jgi:hypothetical protein
VAKADKVAKKVWRIGIPVKVTPAYPSNARLTNQAFAMELLQSHNRQMHSAIDESSKRRKIR